ncbi:DUF882 domain-containing protein [Brucella anthropi]|uniref:Murein endopeptidase K n=3 Tax=Brucella/Ochrobactrum group TaxID=2826938 RepID=A0A6I0CSS9_BRUAN|nr:MULTISPECIES: DUF882 domain-containing protein [Brucella/Ochrobactrum group]MCR5942441.1 DUF882 domain-containing protein [Ochrobactrum sp. XJ1]QOD66145.1 DUF882 domain-containing protein [Ochrobactrum sp. MT180101]QTN04277.1 DUF882 domain-containing protein [Ochrobactrum sp. EEELCW01]KAB2732807.1 DUF882 domain-containing protein [Brucella anthropi]KAB2756422.1 DUF882 domain-containing protein [Brucella anthropi]
MNSISTIKARFAKVWTGMKASMSVPSALAAAAVLMALSPSQASAETRSLKLYYVHTGEKAEIVFKRNGRFDAQGLKKLNVFLRDWRRNEPTKMDPRLFDLVWQVYRSTGSSQYITVVSAYRSPATNAMLRSRSAKTGVAKKSQHMLGRAMDFYIPGVPLAKLRGIGMRYQIGGVGYYPRSGSPFVHMDVGNVRSWPRMSRRELLALFPDGKTAHLPADGKPLPGYEQALAMIEKRKAGGGEILMASNSAPRRSKSLFGALFGGGADEEEDTGDVSAPPATARPARAAPARQAPAAVPEEPVQQPRETMVAALPARDAPLPVQAPRPETGLDAQAQAAAEVPVAALNVPIPARKPAMAPQDAVALAAAEPAADAAAAARAAVDANTVQVADAGTPSQLMNGFVPIPSARPQLETDNMQLAAAVVPSARPTRPGENPATNGQDAIAALVNSQQAEPTQLADAGNAAVPQPGETAAFPLPKEAPRANTQLALLSKRDEIGELIAPPSDDYYDSKPVADAAPKQAPAAVQTASVARTAPAKPTATASAAVHKQVAAIGKAAETGVRTTAKGGRYVAKAQSKPRAVVQPAVMPTSEVAMSTESVSSAIPVTNPVLRNDAMRSAPAMVYTAGFQRGNLPTERANQFSGNAVTFLTVAKFTETN